MDSETGTEIERDKERRTRRNTGMKTGTGGRDRNRQTWTDGQRQK